MTNDLKKYLSILCLLFCYACQTQVALQVKKKGELVKLNSDFSFQGYAGNSLVTIPTQDVFSRFVLFPESDPEEYIFVVEPNLAQGTIEIPETKAENPYAVPQHFYPYFDLVMRAHRYILRGYLTEAENLIKSIDEKYDVTYATRVLLANIAFLQGKSELAVDLFGQAKLLYKGPIALNDLGKK
jgi:hypothetical protein